MDLRHDLGVKSFGLTEELTYTSCNSINMVLFIEGWKIGGCGGGAGVFVWSYKGSVLGALRF